MKSYIKGRVFWIGALDWKDTVPGNGTYSNFHKSSSYNSYLITAKHNFLIDTVTENLAEQFITNLSYEIPIGDLYGIILTCGKDDHTGAVKKIVELNPGVKIYTSPFYLDSIRELTGPHTEIITLETGDTIEEEGLTLEFIDAVPFGKRHSLFSYIREEKILFSGYATEYVIQDILGGDTGNDNRSEPVHKRLQRKIREKIGILTEPDIICTNHGTPMFVA